MTRISKVLTNEQKLRKIIKELDGMELVLFMERIHVIIDATDKIMKTNPEQMENPLVHVDYYKRMITKVKSIIDFGK